MAFELSNPKLDAIKKNLIEFCEKEVVPATVIFEEGLVENGRNHGDRFRSVPPILEDLKRSAKKRGLWNLWMPKTYLPLGAGLTNLEYAQLAEIMGRFGPLASEGALLSFAHTCVEKQILTNVEQ